MILYFDNYITNAPLFKHLYDDLAELRSRSKIYAFPNKLDISLYTLASYSKYPWSDVLIKYELEDKSKSQYFEEEVRKLFPKATIIAERSDSQKKYQQACKIIEQMGDEWIFYAGNNDHPFMCSDFSMLEKCLEKAKEMALENKYVSIWYSHILEGAGLLSNKAYWKLMPELVNDKKIISEDENTMVCRNFGSGDFDSTQIVNMPLLKHWFFGKDMGNKRIRRSGDLAPEAKTEGQIIVYPKSRICEHFDGYSNLNSRVGFDVSSLVPPLFIPPGFFEGKIKIAFGYEEYREGWVNINPAIRKYSFEEKGGTDMKIGLRDLPFFWKERIEKIDINPEIDYESLERLGNQNMVKICYPWPKSSFFSYYNKYVASPFWRLKKFAKRTKIYFDEPEFLEETLDSGSFVFRLYKKAIYQAVKIVKKR